VPISIPIVVRARAGYPDGVPQNDYLPIPVLLSRRLGSEGVAIVAEKLMHRPGLDNADIGAEIMRFTDELPAPEDIEPVRAKLATYGWPLNHPETPRTPNSNPASAHHPARPLGAVAADRRRRAARRA
jgi:hypothetical protein